MGVDLRNAAAGLRPRRSAEQTRANVTCRGTALAGADGDRGVERIERRTLPAGIRSVKRPGPEQAEFVAGVPGVVPEGAGVGQDERAVGRAGAWPAEVA